jgi:hypothetical protein
MTKTKAKPVGFTDHNRRWLKPVTKRSKQAGEAEIEDAGNDSDLGSSDLPDDEVEGVDDFSSEGDLEEGFEEDDEDPGAQL